VAAVATDSGWTYINKEGEELFETRFETAKRFQDGYAFVEPLYEQIGLFNYGVAPFRKNQKWGLLNDRER